MTVLERAKTAPRSAFLQYQVKKCEGRTSRVKFYDMHFDHQALWRLLCVPLSTHLLVYL